MLGKNFHLANIHYTVYNKLHMGDLVKMFLTTRFGHVDTYRQMFERAMMFFVHVDVHYLKSEALRMFCDNIYIHVLYVNCQL